MVIGHGDVYAKSYGVETFHRCEQRQELCRRCGVTQDGKFWGVICAYCELVLMQMNTAEWTTVNIRCPVVVSRKAREIYWRLLIFILVFSNAAINRTRETVPSDE